MRTFLIDLENVKSPGLLGIDRLEAEDRVFIFYSENANTLTISTIQAMNRSKATVEYVRLLHSGHNAMDFQIVALLGFLIGSERKGQFCITSMDNGYVSPVEFFMDHSAGSLDVHVLLAGSIQKALNRWSNMEKQEAAKRVVVADPTEMKDEPEEEKAEAEEAAKVEAEQAAAAEAAEAEMESAAPATAPVVRTVTAPVVEKTVKETAETAAAPAVESIEKPVAEPEKPAETVAEPAAELAAEPVAAPVKRRRGRPRKATSEQKKNTKAKANEPAKAAEQAKPAEAVKPAEQSKAAEQPKAEQVKAEHVKTAEPVKADQPKQPEQKSEQKKSEQKKSEQKADQPKPEQKKQKRRPVVVPPAFTADVHEIVKAHLPEGDQTTDEKMIAEAILATESKNEFYQFLRRALGTKKGGDLYHLVRGDYDRLIAALEKNLNS
ncbi:MAG: hypothetical protein IJK56_05980 [Firmicutes bacterium]|nr:hypothetical protein [Bacillota bacterium]